MTSLEDCVRSAIKGQAVLVVGSGVGFLAKNIGGSSVPSTSRLLELLFAELEEPLDARAPLDRVAAHFGQTKGFPRLYEILKQQMSVKEIADVRYERFLRTRWKRVYTTNFDNAIEVATPDKRPHAIPQDLKAIERGDIVHLNGFVSDIDPIRFDETTNLTSWSYAQSRFPESKLAHFFRTDLRAARHVIFLGLSLGSDLDISRVIADHRIPPDKVIFVVGSDTAAYDVTTLRRYGTVFTDGAEPLLRAFDQIDGTVSPSEDTLPVSSFFSFVRDSVAPEGTRLSLRDQLLFGRLDLDHLLLVDSQRLVGANQRLIGRSQSEQLATSIKEGQVDKAIVHGDIGSGKTFLAIEAARHLYEAGFEVFWARANRFDEEEIQAVAQRDVRTLLVFDGYIEHRDAIEMALNVRNKNTAILICLRTVVYELSRDSIAALFGDDLLTVEMRPLSEGELGRFDGMLLASGLLGNAAVGSTHLRVKRYETKLSASVFRILVDLVRSDHLKEEIEAEIAPILNDQSVRSAFAAILIGCVLETEFDIDQWDECVGVPAVDRLRSKYERMSLHFLDSDGYAFVSRPGVVGTELLREHFPASAVSAGLLKLYKYALETPFAYGSRRLVETVMRYSRIEPLFREDNKYKTLMLYYDSMQDYQQTDGNSQYWLQKAIAASIHGDLARPDVLRRTDNFFATAYARAGQAQNRQRLNIDNYYARYMLMHVLNQEDADRAYSMTTDAILRLMRQIHVDEAKHYPFKAGRTLADIAIKFAPKWPPELKAKMKLSIERLISQAKKWRDSNGHNRDVDNLISDCAAVLPRFD